ncbi:hypothetical protein H0H87_002470, partial [Tephrocybe sp. NHM501043]
MANLPTSPSAAASLTNTLKVVDEMMKSVPVPYMKSVSGTLAHIISLAGENSTTRDRATGLTKRVLRRSSVVLEALLFISDSPEKDQLTEARIKAKLKDYL